jgi:hypothetical protein
MRKHAVLLTLAALEALAVALLGLFWFVMRPDLLTGYGLDLRRADGRSAQVLPLSSQVAFSGWFVLQAAAIGSALMLIAWAAPLRTRARNFFAGTGLVWTVFSLGFAIWAAYAPAFETLGR